MGWIVTSALPPSVAKKREPEQKVASKECSVPREYQFSEQALPSAEQAYWAKYGITTNLLKRYEVVSLKEYRSVNKEGAPFRLVSSPAEPLFGYLHKSFVKVYRPYSKLRFLYGGEMPENYCFGLEQLPAKGDLLFITGGEKDVLSLAALDFYAICFNSETAVVPEEIVRRLSFRFKHIILLYDSDKTGLDSSAIQEQRLQPYGVKRLVLPLSGTKEEKDISDYFRLGNNRKDLLRLFLKHLDRLYSETMNDETESIAVVEELYRLAGIYRTCIITVLHFIPNGLKLRGHLGSELQRKAAAILSIEKDTTDPAISVVKALKVRDGSPLDVPLMQFVWDKEKGMHVYHGEKPREEREKRKEKELQRVAREVFEQQPHLTYIDLSEQIQSIMDVKERTSKSYIKFMRDKEIILRDPNNNAYFIIGN